MAVDSTRVCVGCGESSSPDQLERFVWDPSVGLFFDLRGKAPGRGAYVHARTECLTKAVKFGFRRSFRTDIDMPSADELIEDVRTSIRKRLDESARLAVRSGAAGVGHKAVEQAMRKDQATCLVVAADAGEATRKKFVTNADRKNITVVSPIDGGTIGGWSGNDFVAVMTIAGRLGARFARDVQTLERLGLFGG